MDRAFERLSVWLAKRLGSSRTFVGTCVLILLAIGATLVPAWSTTVNGWGSSLSGYASLLILLVLQNAQNRFAAGSAAKDDELIRVTAAARNELIGAEELGEEEISALRRSHTPHRRG